MWPGPGQPLGFIPLDTVIGLEMTRDPSSSNQGPIKGNLVTWESPLGLRDGPSCHP